MLDDVAECNQLVTVSVFAESNSKRRHALGETNYEKRNAVLHIFY